MKNQKGTKVYNSLKKGPARGLFWGLRRNPCNLTDITDITPSIFNPLF